MSGIATGTWDATVTDTGKVLPYKELTFWLEETGDKYIIQYIRQYLMLQESNKMGAGLEMYGLRLLRKCGHSRLTADLNKVKWRAMWMCGAGTVQTHG